MRTAMRIASILCILHSPAFAGSYWVSADGEALWENCTGGVPLHGSSACSIDTANSKAKAGDTVNIRGGMYNRGAFIQPANSGS